jgi:hypothetical protein
MPTRARSAFDGHVDECEACSRELETERRTIERLELISSLASPETRLASETARLVLEGAASQSKPRNALTWKTRGPLVAAAMLLVATLVWTFATSTRESPVSDSPSLAVSADDSPTTSVASLEDRAKSAVTLALSWLASAQEDDGSWEPTRWGGRREYDVGVTGLSVLALAASDDPAHREASWRGAMFLSKCQRDNGLLGKSFRGSLYNHSVATRALLAVWENADEAARRDLRASIDRAIGFVVAAQSSAGSWGYPDLEGADSGNLSISVWPLRCLLVAQRLEWKGLDGSIDRSFIWIRRALDVESRQLVRYRGHGDHVCEATEESLGWIVRESHGRLESLRHRALDRLARSGEGSMDYYRAYLVSQAIGHGGDPWQASRRRRTAQDLLARQETRGRFEGSWAPVDRWSVLGGRLFSTAFATLALDATL